MTLLFGVPLSHSFFQCVVVVLQIKESYNLTDFERLFYLHYNYCYYYTDRFSTTLLFALLLLQHSDRFSTTLICTITTVTLGDFQRLFYLHYCCYNYCNTDRFSTTLLFALLLLLQHTDRFSTTLNCTIATTTTH